MVFVPPRTKARFLSALVSLSTSFTFSHSGKHSYDLEGVSTQHPQRSQDPFKQMIETIILIKNMLSTELQRVVSGGSLIWVRERERERERGGRGGVFYFGNQTGCFSFSLWALPRTQDTLHIHPRQQEELEIKESFLFSFKAHLFHPSFKSDRSDQDRLAD